MAWLDAVVGVLVVVVAVMLLFAAWAIALGVIGAVSGERTERCLRCGRIGLTDHGERHPDGCPVATLHLGGHRILGGSVHRLHHH